VGPASVRGQRTLGEDVADGKAVTAYAISEVEMLDEAQGRSSDVSGALGHGSALALGRLVFSGQLINCYLMLRTAG
jgi:hypothetical protein